MQLRSFILPLLIVLPMLQLSGCTSTSVSRPPSGGTYISRSAGAYFDQSVQLTDDSGYTSRYTFKGIHRPEYDLNRIYLAADTDGIVYSVNDGELWSQISTGLYRTLSVVSLSSDIMVIAGLDEDGQGYVRRTSDAGQSWETVLTIPRPESSGFNFLKQNTNPQSVIIALSADPFHDDRVYAGTSLGNILIGEQYGKTWTTAHTLNGTIYSSSNFYIRSVIPSPHTLGEVLILTSDNLLYRISNSQQTQIKVSLDTNALKNSLSKSLSIRSVKFITGYPDAIFIGLSDGAAVSNDRGVTWERLPLPADTSKPFDSAIVEASPTNPSRLLVALDDVIYRSEDGGTNWYSTSLNLSSRSVVFLSINPSNPSHVIAVTSPNS